MNGPTSNDYQIDTQSAREMLGMVMLPGDLRRLTLLHFRDTHGNDALLDLLVQFIGLANSVVENNREMIELMLITEGGMHPHVAEKANLPTLFGALNGILLTQGVDQAKTCGGCAFRLGTCANQSLSTTCDAEWCSHPGEEVFMCHEHLDDEGNPTRKCFGYTQFRKRRAG